MRIVRAWSAIARMIACQILHEAFEIDLLVDVSDDVFHLTRQDVRSIRRCSCSSTRFDLSYRPDTVPVLFAHDESLRLEVIDQIDRPFELRLGQ